MITTCDWCGKGVYTEEDNVGVKYKNGENSLEMYFCNLGCLYHWLVKKLGY